MYVAEIYLCIQSIYLRSIVYFNRQSGMRRQVNGTFTGKTEGNKFASLQSWRPSAHHGM